MKNLKRIASILLVISLVFPISILANSSNIIPNTTVGIPDKALYQWILRTLEKNENYLFSQEEAASIEVLSGFAYKENIIKSLQGIEYLTGIKSLFLYNHKLSNLIGIEKSKQLEGIYLTSGTLKNISGIEKLDNLETLSVFDNKLSILPDMRKMENLEYLYLGLNNLSPDEIKAKVPKQFLNNPLWLDNTIWSQNVKRKILLTNPKRKRNITEKTKTIKGITHPKAIIILTTNAEKIDPFYGYEKKVIANSKGEFTLKGLDLDSYKPRRKMYIHELIRSTVHESEAKLVKTISFIPKKVQKIKKFIKLIHPKNKSKISVKTKKIVGKTDKNAIVQLKTQKGKILSQKKANTKGKFTLKNLRLQKYKNKTLYLCEYIAKKGKKKKCVIKKGFKVG